MTDVPPDLWLRNLCTSHPIFPTFEMESSIGKWSISTGVLFPGVCTLLYSTTRSTVTCSNVTQAGVGGRLVVILYQPYKDRLSSSVWKYAYDWIALLFSFPWSWLMICIMLCTSSWTWIVLAMYVIYPTFDSSGQDFSLAFQTWVLVLYTLFFLYSMDFSSILEADLG